MKNTSTMSSKAKGPKERQKPSKSKSNKNEKAATAKATVNDEDDHLKSIIREFGGDDEDYELLKDVDADEEIATSPNAANDVNLEIFSPFKPSSN